MNKDELKGKAEAMKGKVKQAAGDLTDNEDLHDEGVVDEVAGDTQAGLGRARRKVGASVIQANSFNPGTTVATIAARAPSARRDGSSPARSKRVVARTKRRYAANARGARSGGRCCDQLGSNAKTARMGRRRRIERIAFLIMAARL